MPDTATQAANTPPRSLVAGNWKMNGLQAALPEADAVAAFVAQADGGLQCDAMICPPTTLIAPLAQAVGTRLPLGGQDCHAAQTGAYTGDVSAEMLADAGASAVIVGHSERRAEHGEIDAVVLEKALAAHRAGLTAIICVGETLGQRDANLTLDVVRRQVHNSTPQSATPENVVIAYEPVWAIGTGVTPTLDDVANVHAAIRASLSDRFGATGQAVRILYGGSVKPSNASELLAISHVNGALVGGASLKAADFNAIIEAAHSVAAA
ncbi:MAG: triose-phosphate isomerase [Pseudomonadota bacterium]